ncbi:MAG: response regulator [Bdellovibrionales bacterium]|nr:response regulator [Bdellovibrionales bacterium]
MKTILVVEDETHLREAVCDILRSNNYTILEAANGAQAKTVLSASTVDLIVCDMKMPQMNGFELLKWVRSGKYIPFILMTGVPENLEARAVFEMEIDNFIIKPFSRKDLLSAVSEAFGTSSAKTNKLA